MRKKIRTAAFACIWLLAACTRDPPTVASIGPDDRSRLSPIAALGKRLFEDESLSASGRMSCQTCHRPEFAHAAPADDVVSSGGPDLDRPGLRNAPSIRYAGFTPAFGFAEDGTPTGGLFRDGRAADLAAQARLPFLDRREMANPAVADVIAKLRRSANAGEFRRVFGAEVLADPARAFDRLVAAIAQYELENPDFRRFDSRYDGWLAGTAQMTEQELRGLDLFKDPEKGNCDACHPSGRGSDGSPPLFTDFSYDNVGLPRNAAIPANSDPDFHDLGLCGPERSDLESRRDLCGAFKVPSLRNVARTPPYFHNGVFRDLREVVDFYARRDVEPQAFYPDGPGGTAKFNDLPKSVRDAVNTDEVPYDRKPGDQPALTPAEIDDLVAFLKTLDDSDRP
jgi:cytochrome c peroxidase